MDLSWIAWQISSALCKRRHRSEKCGPQVPVGLALCPLASAEPGFQPFVYTCWQDHYVCGHTLFSCANKASKSAIHSASIKTKEQERERERERERRKESLAHCRGVSGTSFTATVFCWEQRDHHPSLTFCSSVNVRSCSTPRWRPTPVTKATTCPSSFRTNAGRCRMAYFVSPPW